MTKQKFEVEVDVPEGYKIKCFRRAVTGELVPRTIDGRLTAVEVRAIDPGYLPGDFILEKEVQYRDPVLPADWGKNARFSDDGKTWVQAELAGYCAYYHDDAHRWLPIGKHHCYKFCQVVDE